MPRNGAWAAGWLCGVVVLAAADARGQGPANVLVVANAASAESTTIAEYYCSKRAIPSHQLLRLTSLPADPPDGIDRADYERRIQAPIAEWLGEHQAQDRIAYIVLTKGIPLRINGGGDDRNAASVDSELSVLYTRLTGASVPTAGPFPNPYFLGDRPVADARQFLREGLSIYLVTRLDGFTVADVLKMIDRGAAASTNGRFILDGKASLNEIGNNWLRAAAERLRALGVGDDRINLDESTAVIADQKNVLGYYSWGSNDPAIRRRDFNLEFAPGAIGGMFVSTDGRTFREPPPEWQLPTWSDKRRWFAGSPQSLAGDLIRAGITGVAGHVAEPLLRHSIRPDILFPAYYSGLTLAEAFYLAMPSLSWMTVVVGDPLAAPFAATPRAPWADPGIDPATEQPTIFSRRRLAALEHLQAPPEALQALMRAESRLRRKDRSGAREDLEKVTALAPKVMSAQFLLAVLYGESGDTEQAIARYRLILEHDPDSMAVLNNLAYLLAGAGKLAEALPMAERAVKLAPNSGPAVDTLGWILFMSGDAARASSLLTRAATLAPNNAEIQLHLAVVHAALGSADASTRALTRALELDPSMSDRPEVLKLRQK
jgi:uncharacterized protein (TIGR03790 family)